MRKLLLSIATLAFSSGALAAGNSSTLACRSLDSNPHFTNVSLQMELPDSSTQLPGIWQNQVITFKAKETLIDNKVITKKVSMKTLETTALEGLLGHFGLGYDFGDIKIVLLEDYDQSEIIMILDISTDGPITKNIYRCK